MKRFTLDSAMCWRSEVYLKGDRDLPDDMVKAMRMDDAPPQPEPEPEETTPDPEPSTEAAVVEFINTADTPAELTVLPSIGTVSATAILDNRPVAGYADRVEVEHFNAALTVVRWVEVFAFALT